VNRCTREQNCWKFRKKILCQEGIETVCRQEQGEENSLSFVFRRKNPLRDLLKVVEHPADSARGCLSEG
jgi:hypothetical protein